MIVYTATIFEKAGSTADPNLSAIIVGIIQTLGAYAGTLLIERSGRKVSKTSVNSYEVLKVMFISDTDGIFCVWM